MQLKNKLDLPEIFDKSRFVSKPVAGQKKSVMAKERKSKAYIGSDRVENSITYVAKTIDEPEREITKNQYNVIVKSLKVIDWANAKEDETTIISRIITEALSAPVNKIDETDSESNPD